MGRVVTSLFGVLLCSFGAEAATITARFTTHVSDNSQSPYTYTPIFEAGDGTMCSGSTIANPGLGLVYESQADCPFTENELSRVTMQNEGSDGWHVERVDVSIGGAWVQWWATNLSPHQFVTWLDSSYATFSTAIWMQPSGLPVANGGEHLVVMRVLTSWGTNSHSGATYTPIVESKTGDFCTLSSIVAPRKATTTRFTGSCTFPSEDVVELRIVASSNDGWGTNMMELYVHGAWMQLIATNLSPPNWATSVDKDGSSNVKTGIWNRPEFRVLMETGTDGGNPQSGAAFAPSFLSDGDVACAGTSIYAPRAGGKRWTVAANCAFAVSAMNRLEIPAPSSDSWHVEGAFIDRADYTLVHGWATNEVPATRNTIIDTDDTVARQTGVFKFTKAVTVRFTTHTVPDSASSHTYTPTFTGVVGMTCIGSSVASPAIGMVYESQANCLFTGSELTMVTVSNAGSDGWVVERLDVSVGGGAWVQLWATNLSPPQFVARVDSSYTITSTVTWELPTGLPVANGGEYLVMVRVLTASNDASASVSTFAIVAVSKSAAECTLSSVVAPKQAVSYRFTGSCTFPSEDVVELRLPAPSNDGWEMELTELYVHDAWLPMLANNKSPPTWATYVDGDGAAEHLTGIWNRPEFRVLMETGTDGGNPHSGAAFAPSFVSDGDVACAGTPIYAPRAGGNRWTVAASCAFAVSAMNRLEIPAPSSDSWHVAGAFMDRADLTLLQGWATNEDPDSRNTIIDTDDTVARQTGIFRFWEHTIAPTPSPPTTQKWRIGCMKTDTRFMHDKRVINGESNTPEQCAQECSDAGYKFAGVEYGKQCFCGNSHAGSALTADNECEMPCTGDVSQTCGDSWRMELYSLLSYTAETVPSNLLGCFEVDVTSRVLAYQGYGSSPQNTPAFCARVCDWNGYAYAGLEDGDECWCGGSAAGTTMTSPDECGAACSGGGGDFCGDSHRMNLYELRQTTAAPTPSKVGCFDVDTSARSLNTLGYVSGRNTLELCASVCKWNGFKYAGLENGDECWCGNDVSGSVRTLSERCDAKTCPGNSGQRCGGGFRSLTYLVDGTVYSGPPMAYAGCYADSPSPRSLPAFAYWSSRNTVEECTALCFHNGYTHAGLQYAGQCWCGNGISSKKHSESACKMKCTGDNSQTCGYSYRSNVYSLIN